MFLFPLRIKEIEAKKHYKDMEEAELSSKLDSQTPEPHGP